MVLRLAVTLAVLSACGTKLAATGDDQTPTDDAAIDDSSVDTMPLPDAPGTFAPWGTPKKIDPAATAALNEDDGTLSGNGLEFIFGQQAADGTKHLFVTKRATVNDAFATATLIAEIDVVGVGITSETPRFADNDLTLYFSSTRTGTLGSQDIFKTTRTALGAAWAVPAPFGTAANGPNSVALEKAYTPCSTKYLVVRGGDLFEGDIGQPPALAANLSDAATAETGPFLAENCTRVYFASPRDPLVGTKIYTATRATMADPWGTPVIYNEFLGVPGNHEDPWISTDGHTFVFAAKADNTASTTKDEYIVTR
ncbi:MAG TPA: hypothetical protein VGM90_24615 [Kofleriaceae bacterium]